MVSYCQGSPVKKKRHKAKEKEPTQRCCLIHVVNFKEKRVCFNGLLLAGTCILD